MGRWSQIHCSCPNRIPIPNSKWYARPYRNTNWKKLSSRQKNEIKIWQENKKGMYECGHRNGMLVELHLGKIVELGFVIKKVFQQDCTFEIYSKVGNWRNYFLDGRNEELIISEQEAELWLMEAVELERAFLQHGNLPYDLTQQLIRVLHQRKVKSSQNLRQQIESIKDLKSYARIVPFLHNLDPQVQSPDFDLKEEFEAIENTKKLCHAAIDSGNPIELLW